MSYYADLKDYLETLKETGKLVVVEEEINKDTELMPLVRWQFRGLPEEQRKAFLFTNVVDSKGKHYNLPAVVGCYAASRDIYALGLQCKPEEIMDRWSLGQRNPMPAILVDSGPAQEEVHVGDTLLEHGGLAELPIPISTPGFDNAPYTSAAHWVTKDPDTGGINVGNYRGMIKSPNRMGVAGNSTHMRMHWEKCKSKGKPLEAALVIGVTPNIAATAVSRVPYGVSEFDVAGGIVGEPVRLIKCKTVDLEVPANAEIVLEGIISTEYVEPEGPFGEFTGYMNNRLSDRPFIEITGITHRRHALCTNILSQMPPSESSKIRQIGREGVFFKFLKYDCNIPSIVDVAFLEAGGASQCCVIKMQKTNPAQPWQALNAAVAYSPTIGKIFVVVDEDIDPRDSDSVNWALSFRMQPHLDTRITMGKSPGLDYSGYPPTVHNTLKRVYPEPRGTSAILIDATRKWAYPPVSLPKREYMENARAIWERLGLPQLQPKEPWFGYSLGYWTEEDAEEAELAVRGEYFQTGAKFASRRFKAE